jgi:nicotinate-nucleotide pyrophosphorylase (carboxylating)
MNLSQLIMQAYAEDIPRGDLTSDSLGLATCPGDARLVAKEDLVLAGRLVFSECVQHSKILDTRKTTPLLREYEKAAVRAGGGQNHRMSLSDAILIKENHIRASGGLKQAVRAIKRTAAKSAIEVECSSLEEVEAAVSEGVQRILLDNMSNAQMAEARAKIPAFIAIEASGNMQLERVGEVARLGVDFISVGALTHSAPCADFSLLFEWPQTQPVKN